MLRDEDAPAPARTIAHRGPMRRKSGGSALYTERDGMRQRAAVACRLESQRVRIGQAVASIQLERDLVEGTPMVDGTSPAARHRRQPMRQLVEQGQALVELVTSCPNRDQAIVAPGDAGRVLPGATTPGEARWRC